MLVGDVGRQLKSGFEQWVQLVENLKWVHNVRITPTNVTQRTLVAQRERKLCDGTRLTTLRVSNALDGAAGNLVTLIIETGNERGIW